MLCAVPPQRMPALRVTLVLLLARGAARGSLRSTLPADTAKEHPGHLEGLGFSVEQFVGHTEGSDSQ